MDKSNLNMTEAQKKFMDAEYDAILHRWRKCDCLISGSFLVGNIYEDAKGRFPNGSRVTTSPGKIVDGILHTKNTRYLLAAEQ